mgnify:CR=1 FL=1
MYLAFALCFALARKLDCQRPFDLMIAEEMLCKVRRI